jgi:hypothetical protein
MCSVGLAVTVTMICNMRDLIFGVPEEHRIASTESMNKAVLTTIQTLYYKTVSM